MSEERYLKLFNLVNNNLIESNISPILFETYSHLQYDNYNFPSSELLAIVEDKVFLGDLYNKLLGRPIEAIALDDNLKKLRSKKLSREQLIEKLLSSPERKKFMLLY